jgi:hypothetical protein
MQITVSPSVRQLRYYLESAINAFETLPTEEAIASNLGHLRRCQQYLDALDRAEHVVVAGISPIEAGVRLERSLRDGDVFDLTDQYFVPAAAGHNTP